MTEQSGNSASIEKRNPVRGRMPVSVIIPMYNAEKTIRRCVESAAGQDVLEIILIDDGSENGSLDAARELAGGDLPVKIRVVTQTHGGVSEARNRGIREAAGEWILFLDADDRLTEDAVRKLRQGLTEAGGAVRERKQGLTNAPNTVRELRQGLTNVPDTVRKMWQEAANVSEAVDALHTVDACCGGILRGNEEDPGGKEKQGCGSILSFKDTHDLLNYVLASPTDRLTIHGWIFRRSVCLENDIFFHTGLRLGEDSSFVLRILAACGEVRFIGSPVYRYTISADSTIHRWRPGQTDGYLYMLEKIGQTPVSAERNWPLFVLTTLLLILTHDTFHPANPAGRKAKLREAARLRELPVFSEAFARADFSAVDRKKRLVLQWMKSREYLLVWAAVKIRQRQNSRRTGKL